MQNEGLLKNLDIIVEYEKIYKNTYKVAAYEKVIDNIQLYDKEIRNVEDLKEIKGIGKGIQEKIVEYLRDGKIQAVEDAMKDPKYILGKQLLGVYGIGPAKISELLDKISSFDELKERQDLLNEKQKIGLKYYEDLEQRIPMAEGKKHYKVIQKAIGVGVEFEMVGSYRRKAKTMGDIDILIKDDKQFNLKKLIGDLQSSGYIIEVLASGKNKFMGICKLPDLPARRIDILVADKSYYYFALLYFTGSYNFNIVMRRVAIDKGLSLSEYGFKDLKTKKLLDIPIESEEDIFKYLDMPYVMPNKR